MKNLLAGLIFLWIPAGLLARDLEHDWHFIKPLVNCTGLEQCTFSNELVCINNTTEDFNCQVISVPNEFSVFNMPKQFTVRWGDSIKIFLKFFSSVVKAPPAGKPAILKFLINSKDTITVSFLIAQASYKNLQVTTSMHNITYAKNQTRLDIPTHIYNKGNIDELVTLQIAEGLFWKQPGLPVTFNLPRFTDTIISLSLKKYSTAEFPADLLLIHVQVLDEGQQLVSSVTVYSQLTGSSLDFDPRFDISQENYITAQVGGIGTNNRYNEYQAGWNRYGQRDGFIFSSQYLQFVSNGFYTLRDAYIGYKYKKWKVKAGTLYDFVQQPLVGQGLQLTYGTKENNIGVSYYFNSNPNAFTNTVSPLRKVSNFLITGNRLLKGNINLSGFLLKQWNGLLVPGFVMAGSQVSFMLHRKDSVEAGLYINGNNNISIRKLGLAASFKMTGATGRVRYQFDNYASSKGFAGILRNALLLDETMTYDYNKKHLKTIQVFIRYLGNNNSSFGASSFFNQYQSSLRIGTALGWTVRKFNFSISPYFSHQYLNYFDTLYALTEFKSAFSFFVQPNRFLSANASLDVSFAQKRTISVGKIKFDNTVPLKFQANIFYKLAGWQLSMQNKPYYIFDLPQENALGRRLFYLVTGPFVSKNLFNNRVQFNGSYNFQLNGRNSVPDHFFNAFVQNNINKQFSVNAMYVYINRAVKDYREFRIGVRYNLPNKIIINPVRRQLFLYEDINQNDIFDTGENPLENIIFAANQSRLLKTDNRGKLSLVNYRPKIDRLELINGQGYGFFKDISDIHFDKRISYIGMIRLGQASGNITITQPRFSTRKPALNGIGIVLTDANGKEFLAYTNENGAFQIFLPVGKYIVTLNKMMLPYLKLAKPISIEIVPGAIQKLTLELDDLETPPVEIKKFNGGP